MQANTWITLMSKAWNFLSPRKGENHLWDKQSQWCDMCVRAVKDAKWEFLVLLPLFDPPRHDTKETIENCIAKGIQVKMVTGDQLLIGKETAKQLGMGTNMYTTEVLLNVSCCPSLLIHSCASFMHNVMCKLLHP